MIEPCNNTSVGILVYHDDKLLLIERRKPPYGWAPPAGHVDDEESYAEAAARELQEEVGLKATNLRLLLARRYENRCRRPGGDEHVWQVFEAVCDGEPVRSEDETSAMRWFTRAELDELSQRSSALLTSDAGSEQWREAPGLEPVWIDMLNEIETFRCDCCPNGGSDAQRQARHR